MESCASSEAVPDPPTSAKSVLLFSRTHLSRVDQDLCGTSGAQRIISQLNAQRSAVTQLTLNHNPLGEDGTSHLFNYLCSTTGSRHRTALSEISLNCTDLGGKGLQAISDYIRGNENLRRLWLASNKLLPDPTVFSSLAGAINNSRLRFLSLASNNQLGDAFVEQFLPFLRSRHLRELHINAVGLTPRSAPVIGAWISGNPKRDGDGMCHLHVLKVSGNSLGVNGVREIVRAIEGGNWGITKVEIYANQLAASPGLPSTETEDAMKDAERTLHRVLMRNGYWKRETEKEALVLLKYSRPLLLRPRSSPSTASPSAPPSPPLQTATSLFPFYALPNELKVYILGLLTPSLSAAQRMRIHRYASNPSTLPTLLPTLRRDPSASVVINLNSTGQRAADGNGKNAGANNSPLCRRDEERNRFFEEVGCCAYEPERRGYGMMH